MALAALVALMGLAGAGCHVRLTATVEVDGDGSGLVRAGVGLDAEALAELGDPALRLRLDDLRAAGWTVVGPRQEVDGLTWARASKPFATPDEAVLVAAELSGPGGPFRDLRVERTRSPWRTAVSFAGAVDLSQGLAGLADSEVVERLGDDLDLDVASLRNRFGDALEASVQVELRAELPGSASTLRGAFGEERRLELVSRRWNLDVLVPAVASLLLAGGALVAVRHLRRRPYPR